MKYIKLYEDHKETREKIEELESKLELDKKEIIKQYKSIVDEFLFDIMDYYDTECEMVIKGEINNVRRYNTTYLTYRIKFTADKYRELFDMLRDSIDRLKDAHDITHVIDDVFDHEHGVRVFRHGYRYPYDFSESSIQIKKYLELTEAEPKDIKLQIDISF